MSDQSRHLETINTTLRQHPTNNSILVSLWNITAGDHDIVQEKARVGTILPRVGHFSLRQGRIQPLGLDDGDQSIVGGFEGREVDGLADEVGKFLQGWEN